MYPQRAFCFSANKRWLNFKVSPLFIISNLDNMFLSRIKQHKLRQRCAKPRICYDCQPNKISSLKQILKFGLDWIQIGWQINSAEVKLGLSIAKVISKLVCQHFWILPVIKRKILKMGKFSHFNKVNSDNCKF